jgi:hypothetical protein
MLILRGYAAIILASRSESTIHLRCRAPLARAKLNSLRERQLG